MGGGGGGGGLIERGAYLLSSSEKGGLLERGAYLRGGGLIEDLRLRHRKLHR